MSATAAAAVVPFPLDLVFTPVCFQSLLVDFNVLNDVDCLKAVVSKTAGYAIVVLAAILKLPIVINILRNKSVSGLSAKSLYLENSMYVCHFTYNYLRGSPFSTYGESFPILMQNLVITALMWKYNKTSMVAVASLLMAFVCLGFAASSCPPEWQFVLIGWVMTASIISRMPQITSNFFNGHTGILSVVTSGLQVSGALVRFMTVLLEVKDPLVRTSSMLSLTVNGTILLQIIYYWTPTRVELQRVKESRKKSQGKTQ